MWSTERVKASRFVRGAVLLMLAVDLVGWGLLRYEHAHVASLRAGMTFDELSAAFGRPLWSVGKDPDLASIAENLHFRPTPLVGRCLNAAAVGDRSYATASELPWIRSPWTAPQVWLFRTGLISAVLVYPGDDGRARCILSCRPSAFYALFGGD